MKIIFQKSLAPYRRRVSVFSPNENWAYGRAQAMKRVYRRARLNFYEH